MADDVAELLKQAIAHHIARQLANAERAYRAILQVQPDHAHVHYLLGHLLYETGRLQESVQHQQRAAQFRPGVFEYRFELAQMYAEARRTDDAITAYQAALALRPDAVEVLQLLGNALQDAGRFDDAVNVYHRAIALRPDIPELHNNLGNALQNLRRFDESIASYSNALEQRRDYPDALNNLGCALKESGRWDEAISRFRGAIELRPEYPEAHWNVATALLTVGDLRAGWRHYEWRSHFATTPPRAFNCPQWRGELLDGRRILLHAEQGFGDTIQFVRFAAEVVRRGGRIVLECQPQLVRLLKGVAEIETVVAQGEPLPPFDVHCPLLSLPLALNVSLQDLPGAVSYLRAGSKGVERWAGRLAGDTRRLKVGIAWAGSSLHVNDRNRSIAADQLEVFGDVPNVAFYSLQTGGAAPPNLRLTNLTADLADFADTAALVANLDMVITVDTAVAHLSAAMGKPTWILLPTPGDFRWLLHREDSPWYPTARLFRQVEPSDWREPIARVREALFAMAQ